jgi:hypothetical protein
VEFWSDEALLTHTLHTVIIDQQGNLVTNMEGNQYTAEQLGDLLQTTWRENGNLWRGEEGILKFLPQPARATAGPLGQLVPNGHSEIADRF